MQRTYLTQDGNYSSLFWTLHSWNVHRAQQLQQLAPGQQYWATLLGLLRLSQDQQQQMLGARARFLKTMDAVGRERWDIIGQLGLAALDQPEVIPPSNDLRHETRPHASSPADDQSR